jgi:predicted cobalt transporter CbtA
MEAAALEGRLTWWIFTAVLTATGRGLIGFGHISLKAIGLVLLAIPHLLGAPQPDMHGFVHTDATAVTALESLAADFLWATAVANGIFWLIVGVTSGYFINKFKILEEKI